MSETAISSETTATSKKRPPKETFVQFRISLDEFASLFPIAKQAFNEGKIKAPTISALARASLMTMANLKLKIDEENERIREADRKRMELQAMTGPCKIPYANLQSIQGIIANVPSYHEFITQQKRVVI